MGREMSAELIGFFVSIIGFFFNSLYHIWTDMILSGRWERKEKLLWIGRRQHLFKTLSLIMIFAGPVVGRPTWYNAIGWILFGYGTVWNLSYSWWKLGHPFRTDGQFLLRFSRLIDWRWDPSDFVWAMIVVFGCGAGGIILSVI